MIEDEKMTSAKVKSQMAGARIMGGRWYRPDANGNLSVWPVLTIDPQSRNEAIRRSTTRFP